MRLLDLLALVGENIGRRKGRVALTAAKDKVRELFGELFEDD